MNLRSLRTFRSSLGPLEQAQIVVSTAVVVTMITMVAFRIVSGEKMGWYDFVSVTVVGLIGFLIVYSTITSGRQLENQKQELLSLNTIAEAVNRAVDIPYLLQSTLQELKRLLDADHGWIYLVDGTHLSLRASRGTEELKVQVIDPSLPLTHESITWIRSPRIEKRALRTGRGEINSWPMPGIGAWASVPILMKDQLFGLLIVASRNRQAFGNKQIDLMTAFANHIGIAMENSALLERLRKSEERYMDLFERSPDMYHIVNSEGTIISCNQTEALRLGYRKDDLVGQSFLKLYPPEYHPEAKRRLERVFLRREEVRSTEEQMLTSSGELVDVSINTSVTNDEAGTPVLLRVVVRDITDKKKLEAKILHAQRIDSVGNLAGGVAHDFNNILTSILGSTAIMRRKMRKTDTWYRFVEIIETAAKRGAGLTRQLLTFARKTSVEFRPLVLNDIIDETLHLFERSIDKTISIRRSGLAEQFIINGDDGQIQQALLNLLINARDAMPEGGTIHLACHALPSEELPPANRPDAQHDVYAAITVTDTGIGMDRRTQQHIFEPFFTTKDQGKGTGLGLSVVYGVVNAHNGFILVKSEPQRGAQFTLFLPLLRDSEILRKLQKPQRLAKGKQKVLVVDDERQVRDVMQQMLKDLGYRVTAVSSGRQAVNLYAKKKRFDAVLLDLNMPRMGGKETFFRLKEIDPNIRVVVVTGYSQRTMDSFPLRNEVEGFLQKPFQMEELSEVLRIAIDKR